MLSSWLLIAILASNNSSETKCKDLSQIETIRKKIRGVGPRSGYFFRGFSDFLPASSSASTWSTASRTAALGAPTANAPKMSPSMWGQLDGLLQEQYKQCWNYIALGGAQKYIPQIKVEFSREGGLVGQPALLNPPGDANLNTLSESALRAVRRCNPLKIPAQFVPYYEQWKSRILRFDPEEMAG